MTVENENPLKCIYRGRIELGDAIGFIVLYFIYVIFVFMQDKFFSEYELQTEKSVRPSHDGSNVEALRIRQKSFSGLSSPYPKTMISRILIKDKVEY